MALSKRTKIITGVGLATVLVGSLAAGSAISRTKGFGGFGGHGMMRGMGIDHVFTEFDTNKDGTITKDEVTATQAAALQKHDANGDGNLSLDEFTTYATEKARFAIVRGFQFLDRDGNSQVTTDELTALPVMVFERVDQNNDNRVTKADVRNMRGKRGHWRKRHRDNDERSDNDNN